MVGKQARQKENSDEINAPGYADIKLTSSPGGSDLPKTTWGCLTGLAPQGKTEILFSLISSTCWHMAVGGADEEMFVAT